MGKPKRTPEEIWANHRRNVSIERMDKSITGDPPPYSSLPPSTATSSTNVGNLPPSTQASTSNVGTAESTLVGAETSMAASTGTSVSTSVSARTSTLGGAGASTLIPGPAFDNLDFTPSPLELPTAAECIAHLKLLHAFAKLRHEVGNQEGLFGIETSVDELHHTKKGDTATNSDAIEPAYDSHQPEGVHGQEGLQTSGKAPELSEAERAPATLAEQIRDKRWTIFVTKAVDRFEKWWNSLRFFSREFPATIRMDNFDPAAGTIGYTSIPSDFPIKGSGLGEMINDILPPLDVLMVWHAYMLNPRIYLEDCMRKNKHTIWHTPFPWKQIHNLIDSEFFTYYPSEKQRWYFEQSTHHPWNATEDSTPKTLACPRCLKTLNVPYTRPPMMIGPSSGPKTLADYLTSDTGFAGKDFQEACPSCEFIITHEKLRVAKFIRDADAVWISRLPLPGTILNSRGIPQMTEKNKKIESHDPFFPNRVILTLSEFQSENLRKEIRTLSIEVLKQRFENVLRDTLKTRAVNKDQYEPETVHKESRIAIRKLLSHYWDNSSAFGIDLVGAVIRQAGFVQKMRKIDWLHSPAAMVTMQRLIVKYHRFVRIVADNPKLMAVPTLDVDLAWHTHQLSPQIYYSYTLSETQKHLNHDDKIPSNTLHTSFQRTSLIYEKKYGTPYAECACWYCECTREPLRSSFTNKIINPLRPSKPSVYDPKHLHEKIPGLSKDAVMGPHISAHNSISMGNGTGGVLSPEQQRRELEALDLTYAKVLLRYQKSASKKSKHPSPPGRTTDAHTTSAYGHPLYIPLYIPYYPSPTCEGDRYTTAGAGGVGGGCASGTCSVSAGLGGCAGGDGTPGCSASCGGHGDASGGCGTCSGGDGGGCGGCGG